jgi:hypothetical protein
MTDGGLVCVDLTTNNDGCGIPNPGCAACGGADSGACCKGSCFDTMDPFNCGGCGNVCISGSCILGDAGTGICNCPLPYSVCPENDGGSACVDPYSDSLNCGVCGHACPSTQDCVLGECRCKPSPTVVECDTDGGLVCVDLSTNPDGCGIRDPGCEACGGEDSANCCSGFCSNLLGSSDCGACGNICISGSCILGDAGTGVCDCPAPYSWCGPVCVDIDTDYDHCGGCTTCSAPATQCVQGRCR